MLTCWPFNPWKWNSSMSPGGSIASPDTVSPIAKVSRTTSGPKLHRKPGTGRALDLEHQIGATRGGYGHAEFVHVAREIDRLAAHAVAKGQCRRQPLRPPIDPIQEEPICPVVEVGRVVRDDAADAEAVGSGPWQRKSTGYLAKQAGVGADALDRPQNRPRSFDDVELERSFGRSVLGLEERVELLACDAGERELVDVPREVDRLPRNGVARGDGGTHVLRMTVDRV